MESRERIIVSVTTWWKRAGNLSVVLKSILAQTLMPSRILVNLCTEDFPAKEEDLPQELRTIIDSNDIIELYWTDDNTKAWKKHLHALEVATDDDLIMSIDDDHIYPSDYIEKMYVSYLYYGKEFPITLNKILLFQNMWCFNGPGILYRKRDLPQPYEHLFTYNILHHCANDTAMTLFFAANGVVCMPMLYEMPDDNDMLFNDNDAYTDKVSIRKYEKTPEAVQESVKVVDDLHLTSKDALEETFLLNGLVTKDCRFSPNFWEPVQTLFKSLDQKYAGGAMPAMEYIISKWKESPMEPNVYDIDFKSLGLHLHRKTKDELIGKGNRLVVTVSSWTKRISNIPSVVDDIMHGTLVPDVVVINLAREDFNVPAGTTPGVAGLVQSGAFPEALLTIYEKYPQVHIHWYDDASLKSWKKHLYVMSAFNEDDVIVCIDDDIKYRETFLETMVKSYDMYGRKHPVTGCVSSFQIGAFPFHGSFMLYTPGFFKGYRKYLTKEILHMGPEDNHMGFMLAILGKLILPVIGSDYLVYDTSFNEGDSNFGNGVFDDKWWDAYKRITKCSEGILNEEERCNPLYEGAGWIPRIYNFTYDSTARFLDETEGVTLPYPFDMVRETVKHHFETKFGDSGDETNLEGKIHRVII